MDYRRAKIIALSLVALVGLGMFVYRDLIFRPPSAQERLVGTALPDITLTQLDRQPIHLSSLLEQKPKANKVVLVMWATWCEPCIKELPLVEKLKPQLEEQGIQVQILNYDGPLAEKSIPEVSAWLTANKINLATYFDFGEVLLKWLDISGLPFTVGLTREDRKVAWLELGVMNWKKVSTFTDRF